MATKKKPGAATGGSSDDEVQTSTPDTSAGSPQSDGAQSGAGDSGVSQDDGQSSGDQGSGTQAGTPPRAYLDAALAALPGDYTDADYVVTQMSNHFGDLFTADDEAAVRAAVVAPSVKSDEEPAAEELEFPVLVVIENGSSVPLSFPEVKQFVPANAKSEPFKVFNADQLQRLRTDAAFTAFRNAAGDVAVILE